MSTVSNHYDVVFSGFGVSAALLVRQLARNGQLSNKRICVVEPADIGAHHKSLCFWAAPDADIVRDNKDVIQRSWTKAQVKPFRVDLLEPYTYYQASGSLLLESAQQLLMSYGADWVTDSVVDLSRTDAGVVVTSSNAQLVAERVFDSRPPVKSGKSTLLQSFLGLRVRTANAGFDAESICLMDFSVPQTNGTQFVYVLPESEDTALVEFTRFGCDPISHSAAQALLHDYLQDWFGGYSILSQESGVIPMDVATGIKEEVHGVVSIGTRAGAVKPSTGYAFENMYDNAKQICRSSRSPDRSVFQQRFAFYDTLLIDILRERPQLGKPIFLSLFKNQKMPAVLRFLHQKSSVVDEAKIFLPCLGSPFSGLRKKDCRQV